MSKQVFCAVCGYVDEEKAAWCGFKDCQVVKKDDPVDDWSKKDLSKLK